MVVDQTISEALNRIADNQEEINDTLKRILGHYDGVVPVMTRNQKRVEAKERAIDEELANGFGQQVKNIFKPHTN